MVFIPFKSHRTPTKLTQKALKKQHFSVKHYVLQYKIKWPTVDTSQTLVIIIAKQAQTRWKTNPL